MPILCADCTGESEMSSTLTCRVDFLAVRVENLVRDEHGFMKINLELSFTAPADDYWPVLIHQLHIVVIKRLRRTPRHLIRRVRDEVFPSPRAVQ